MKKLILTLFCAMAVISTAIAQNGRIVKGVVLDAKGTPISGVTITAVGSSENTKTASDGKFSLTVATLVREVKATSEGYIDQVLMVDGSYLMFNLKVDKAYLSAKAKAEEQARIDEQKRAEAERIANEKAEAAKVKAAEQAKIDAQKKAEAERVAKVKAEKARIAKIAAEKRRKVYAEVQKGFGSMVDVTGTMGILNYYNPSIGVSYTGGYRFNNQLFLGIGVGANLNFDGGHSYRSISDYFYLGGDFLDPCLISVPAFIYFRANFIDRRCSPFFALSVGGNFSTKQTLDLDLCSVKYSTIGVFANPQLGVNFRTTTKTSVYLAVGFQCITVPYCPSYTGYSAKIGSAIGYDLNFHVGVTF